jgi:hypothetical protein
MKKLFVILGLVLTGLFAYAVTGELEWTELGTVSGTLTSTSAVTQDLGRFSFTGDTVYVAIEQIVADSSTTSNPYGDSINVVVVFEPQSPQGRLNYQSVYDTLATLSATSEKAIINLVDTEIADGMGVTGNVKTIITQNQAYTQDYKFRVLRGVSKKENN